MKIRKLHVSFLFLLLSTAVYFVREIYFPVQTIERYGLEILQVVFALPVLYLFFWQD